MALSNAWLDARITATQAAIEAAEAGELTLISGSAQSYTLDTGQSRQTVTKPNTTEVRKYIDSLYQRYNNLCNLKNGGQTKIVAPGF